MYFLFLFCFFFNDTATTEIYTLSLHDALPILGILAMNATGFTMPEAAYYNPTAYGGASGIDLAAWTFNFVFFDGRSEEHTSELQSRQYLVCRLLLEKKKITNQQKVRYAHVKYP